MSGMTETKLEMPTVTVEVRIEGEEWGHSWIELPFVPTPGDRFKEDYDRGTFEVVRREISEKSMEPWIEIRLIVRRLDG